MPIKTPGILCLFSAPLLDPNGKPLDLLDIETEENEIRKSVDNSPISHLRTRFATIAELIRGITDGFNIIHLSGHGNEDFLLFEDEKGGSQLLKRDFIKKIFGKSKGIDLVVVSACHSENVARPLIEAGVKYVVAIRKDYPVYDFAATAFVSEFYSTLFKGHSIQDAFDIAKLSVEGNPQWDKMREEIKQRFQKEGKKFLPEERKFLLLPDDRPIDKKDQLTLPGKDGTKTEIDSIGEHKTNIPAKQSRMFTGRSKEMYDVVNKVILNPLVTIKGAGGIGKTTLAIEVGRWFHLRNYFKDGIHKIDMRSMETSESVMSKIGITLGIQFENESEFFNQIKHLNGMFIMDNAEDVLWKDMKNYRSLVNNILESAGNIKILTTSQKEIGGTLYEKEDLYRLVNLDMKSSIELFVKRIKVNRKSINDDDFYKLLNILGGHPLSIIIMASQLSEGISIGDLLTRIEKYKAKAVKGITDIDPSHGESLVKTLYSAYDHIPEKARILFELLSYFPTGIDKNDLDQIMGENCEDYMAQLMDVSLMEMGENNRCNLLPSVRLFSQFVLRDEIKDEYESKILSFMAGYSDFIERNYFSEKAYVFKLLFLMEEANLRYAAENIKVEVSESDEHSLKISLSDNLLKLYNYSDWIDEGLTFGERILIQFQEIGAKLGEANTWKALGDLRVRRAKLQEAEENYLHCLEMYKEIGAKLGEANAMTGLARLLVLMEDFSKVGEYLKKANDLYVEIADSEGQSYICEIKMLMCLIQQKASESICELEQCLNIKRKTENYSETLGWLLFYAKHLNKKGLSTEANLCLDYARKLAEQAKSRDLKKMIENFSLT